MDNRRFAPRPQDKSSHIIALSCPIASITANVTSRYGLGAVNDKDDGSAPPSRHLGFVDEVFVATYTVPADADGTILLSIIKYDASAAAEVVLVTAVAASVSTGDLELLTAGKAERLTIDAAATELQRTLDPGDFLFVRIVNNSAAIDTQPVALAVTALVKLLV